MGVASELGTDAGEEGGEGGQWGGGAVRLPRGRSPHPKSPNGLGEIVKGCEKDNQFVVESVAGLMKSVFRI